MKRSKEHQGRHKISPQIIQNQGFVEVMENLNSDSSSINDFALNGDQVWQNIVKMDNL